MLVGKGKRVNVTLKPGKVVQSLFGLGFSCLLEHGWCQIDAHRMADGTGEGACQQTRSASDVERSIFRTRLGHLHDPVQCLLIADGSSFGEGDCLTRELIEDAGA